MLCPATCPHADRLSAGAGECTDDVAREHATGIALLSEPAADTRLLGRLYSVGDMSRLSPISEARIDRDLNADWAEKNGAARVTPKNLEQLLTAGKPVAPGDKLIDEWSYAPWCRATFVAGGRRWSVAMYLGGFGVIADDAERKGAFRFDVPPGDAS
jgi:hypothetical protein